MKPAHHSSQRLKASASKANPAHQLSPSKVSPALQKDAAARPGWNDSTVVVSEEKKHVFRPQPLKAKSKSLRRHLKRSNSRASSIGSSNLTLNSLNYMDSALMKTAGHKFSNQHEALEL